MSHFQSNSCFSMGGSQRAQSPQEWTQLPWSCCSKISSLTKSSQGKAPHLFLAVSSLAQVCCPGCLPSFQERNKHCPCSVPMGQSGFVLILSIIHLSLSLHSWQSCVFLCFSFTSAQVHTSFLSLVFKLCGNSNGSTKSFGCGKWVCFLY